MNFKINESSSEGMMFEVPPVNSNPFVSDSNVLSIKGAVTRPIEENQTAASNVLEMMILKDPIFHLSTKSFSRGNSDNVLARVAYRSGCLIRARSGLVIGDFRNRLDVIHTEIVAPYGAPDWVLVRNELWLAACEAEIRSDAREGREINVSIPAGLIPIDAVRLARSFAKYLVEKYNCVIDFSIHRDKRKDWQGQNKSFDGFHVHFVLTTRALDGNGFSRYKLRDMDKKSELIVWREKWENLANASLAMAGICKRIDHRSNKKRGILAKPSAPLGPAIVALERRGIRTLMGDAIRKSYDELP